MQFEKTPKTTNIRLTHSEAHWIETNMRYGSREGDLKAPKEGITRKVIRARREAVAKYLPANFFDGFVELWSDMPAGGDYGLKVAQFMGKEAIMASKESEHGFDEAGNELHTISLQLNDDEVSMIYAIAKQAHEISTDVASSASAVNDEESWAKIDPNYTPEQVAHIQVQRDREANELFEENFDTVQVTSGIVAAIVAHRAAPPSA
jgi:hypothetical protein